MLPALQHKNHRTRNQETTHFNTRITAPETKGGVGKRRPVSAVAQRRRARYFYTVLYTFNNIQVDVEVIKNMEGENQKGNDEDALVAEIDSVVTVGIANRDEAVDSKNEIVTSDERGVSDAKKETVPSTGFVKIEKSLASLGFFTPSSRRVKNQKVKTISFTREIEGKRVEVSADIVPSSLFGLPITGDQDKYLALQKLITNILQAEGKIANPIRFKSADLLRLLNDSTKSGKNYKDVSEWLDVMSSTTIFSNGAVWVDGQKRFARDRFRVFDRAVSVGKELDDGTVADANYVWLSSWQLENINNKFLLPIDLETYRELKNHISKALVPLLQIWLFASHRAGFFEKRYNELCEILTVQTYRSPSEILRQLKPSLDELTRFEYLEKWRIEKTSDRKAYKIIFFHGPKFHRDRRKRLDQKSQAEAVVVVAESESFEPSLPEPGKIQESKNVVPEVRKVEGVGPQGSSETGKLVDALATRGIMPSAALKLLASIPNERLPRVMAQIEYWDTQKKGSNVGVGLLYNLIKNGDPLPNSFQTRKQQEERLVAEQKRTETARIEASRRAKYEAFCRQATDRFIADFPGVELDRRAEEYTAGMRAEPGFWSEKPELAAQFARHAVRAEIAKAVKLPTYEDFCKRERELPKDQNDREKVGSNIAPELLYATPTNDPIKDELFVVSDENSSPRAV